MTTRNGAKLIYAIQDALAAQMTELIDHECASKSEIDCTLDGGENGEIQIIIQIRVQRPDEHEEKNDEQNRT